MNDTELDQFLDTWQAPAPSPSLRRLTLAALPPRPRRKFLGVPLRWAIAATLAFGGFAVGTSIWNNPEIGRFYGETSNFHMRSTRRVEPPSAVLRWFMKDAGNSIGETESGGLQGYGYLRDRSADKFYGYRYTVAPVGGGAYRVEFAPFDEAALGRAKSPFKLSGDIVQAAPVGAPQIIHDGDTFDANLYVDGAGRVYDRIQISSHPFADEPKHTPSPEERAYEATKMELSSPRVYINGVFVGEDDGGSSGGCVWVYVPGEGRYLIAVNPDHNPNFAQAGHVNGNSLQFISDGKEFFIQTDRPIAQGGDRPVYVFHQRSFEDEINGTRGLMTGSAGPPSMHR